MSTVLKYEVGESGAFAILNRNPYCLANLESRRISRPYSLPSRYRYAFSVRLPADVYEAFKLMKLAREIASDSSVSGVARRTCRLLCYKLYMNLGLPWWWYHENQYPSGNPAFLQEWAFVDSIKKDTANLTNWSIYSDWLQDQTGTIRRLRGEVIASWLGKEEVKTKNAMSMTALRLAESILMAKQTDD